MLGFSAVGAGMLASCAPVHQFGGVPDSKPAEIPPASAKYLVLIVIDACRGDYLGYGNLPNIRSLMKRGTYYPHAWTGQMEAITPASHASVGTGMFPKHDGGVLGFWWENPETHTPYTCAPLTNSFEASKPGGRHAVAPEVIETILKDSKSQTIASLLKDVDPAAKVYASSGNKFYAADAMGGPDADYITYFWNNGPTEYRPISMPGHELPPGILDDPALRTNTYGSMIQTNPGQQDSLVVDLALKVVERERPRIVMLNLPEVDWPDAHVYGGPLDASSRQKVTQLMEKADVSLGKLFDLYRKLGIFEDTVFAVIGDHGVTPLQQLVDRTPAEQAAANAGTGIGDDDYHTGGFLWLDDPTRAMKVTSFIDSAKMQGVKGVYFQSQLDGRSQYLPSPATASSIPPELDGAYRYLLETMNGPHAPHVALMYQERTGTAGAGGAVTWKGDHGGPTWGSQTIAMVMAGPGIRASNASAYPARLVDLTPTFLRLLGAPYPQLDGVALADAFTNPTRSEKLAHRAASQLLVPIAGTLRRQSILDIQSLPGSLPGPTKPTKPIKPVGPGTTGSGKPQPTPTPTLPPQAVY